MAQQYRQAPWALLQYCGTLFHTGHNYTHRCFGEFLCYFLKLEKPEVGVGGFHPTWGQKG